MTQNKLFFPWCFSLYQLFSQDLYYLLCYASSKVFVVYIFAFISFTGFLSFLFGCMDSPDHLKIWIKKGMDNWKGGKKCTRPQIFTHHAQKKKGGEKPTHENTNKWKQKT